MAQTDDEFLDVDLDDDRAVAFIKAYVPQEQKDKLSDDEYLYVMDLIEEFCVKSDLLNAEPDAEGFIDVELGEIVDFIIKEAHKDQVAELSEEETLFIVQGYMEYLESLDD